MNSYKKNLICLHESQIIEEYKKIKEYYLKIKKSKKNINQQKDVLESNNELLEEIIIKEYDTIISNYKNIIKCRQTISFIEASLNILITSRKPLKPSNQCAWCNNINNKKTIMGKENICEACGLEINIISNFYHTCKIHKIKFPQNVGCYKCKENKQKQEKFYKNNFISGIINLKNRLITKEEKNTKKLPPSYFYRKTKIKRKLKDQTIKEYQYWELRKTIREPNNWEKIKVLHILHLGKAELEQTQPNEQQKQKAIDYLNQKISDQKQP